MPAKAWLDAPDRAASGRHHRRERLCGQVVSDGQSVLTLATGEARDVAFDIATPDAIPSG
jgi:hypothetical protein